MTDAAAQMRSNWSLKQFSRWYLGAGESLQINVPGENAILLSEHFIELVLWREPPFQAGLVILFPGHHIPPHYHPNVHNYSLSLTGAGEAIVGGRVWTKRVQDRPRLDLRIPVLSGLVHYGYTESGSAFLSLQKWLHGTAPGFLREDWVDAPDWPLAGGIKTNAGNRI